MGAPALSLNIPEQNTAPDNMIKLFVDRPKAPRIRLNNNQIPHKAE